jgi:hypothetical protein
MQSFEPSIFYIVAKAVAGQDKHSPLEGQADMAVGKWPRRGAPPQAAAAIGRLRDSPRRTIRPRRRDPSRGCRQPISLRRLDKGGQLEPAADRSAQRGIAGDNDISVNQRARSASCRST